METSTNKSENGTLLCYSKCKPEKLDNGLIFLNMLNDFDEEKFFIVENSIRDIILECMATNISNETCGENFSRCKPLVPKVGPE